jgi:hypothetical protein
VEILPENLRGVVTVRRRTDAAYFFSNSTYANIYGERPAKAIGAVFN